MSAFHDCQKIESESYIILSSYAKEVHGFDLDRNEDVKSQLSGEGDALVHMPCGPRYVELKAEMRYTGNLFIEEYSNKTTGRLGWLSTSQAKLLWYHFLDMDICYAMEMAKLREWMASHASRYRNVLQTKHKQHNLTTGWLVPVRDLLKADVASEHYPLKELSFAVAN